MVALGECLINEGMATHILELYHFQFSRISAVKTLSCHCRQELTPGVNISVKVISGDESEKQVWQWLEAGLQDLRNWSLVQLRDMMGCVCGFEPVH